MSVLIDYSGVRFEMVVLHEKLRHKNGVTWWSATCDCGNELEVSTKRIRRGTVYSCGCVKRSRAIQVPEGMTACEVPSPSYPEGRTGTDAGYQAHRKAGEEPCIECCRAHEEKCASRWGSLNEDERTKIRELNRAAARRYSERNPGKRFESSLSYRKQSRAMMREAKNQPCKDCGVKYPYYVMQFDHVRGTKEFNIGVVGPTASRDRMMNEIAKCEVVCANCHAARTHERLQAKEVRDAS